MFPSPSLCLIICSPPYKCDFSVITSFVQVDMESPALSRRREAPRLISSWKKQFVIAYRRNSWLHWQQCNQLLRRCPNTKRANLRRHWVCVAKTPSTQEALTARKVRMWCCWVTISKKIQLFEYCGDCSCHLTGCNANISSSTVLDLHSAQWTSLFRSFPEM